MSVDMADASKVNNKVDNEENNPYLDIRTFRLQLLHPPYYARDLIAQD